jgi:hypothetical protein
LHNLLLLQGADKRRQTVKKEIHMKTSLLMKLAMLLVIAATLSGCLWVVDDEGYGRGGGGGGHRGGGDRGEHHGERH